MKYGMKVVCQWGEASTNTTLYISPKGDLYIERYEQSYEKPLLAKISKVEAAERIAAEKFEFSQEELVFLKAYAILKLILPLLADKFRR